MSNHVNVPQTRKELTDYNNMRAFTMEGNFAAAQAVHKMLLQSWGNLVRVFPATPEEWADASFSQLRAEGGFMVNAERKGNEELQCQLKKDQILWFSIQEKI